MRKNTFLLAALLTAGLGMAEAQETVNVTYTYTLGGTVIGTRTVAETMNSAPTDNTVPTDYVDATGYPETVTGTAYTITTSYKETLPFTVSTEGDEHWYVLEFYVGGFNKSYYCFTNAGATYVDEAKFNLSTYTTANEDQFKFKMEGDWLNGFTIRNKTGKYISVDNPSGIANTGNATKTIYASDLVTTETATADSRFLLDPFGSGQWRFKLNNEKPLYIAHTSDRTHHASVYYDSSRPDYAGANTIFLPADDVTAAREQLGKTDMFYPSGAAESRTALNNLLNNDNVKITPQVLTQRLNAYLAETANNMMAKTDVGYPTATSEVRTTLAALAGNNMANSQEIVAAIENYKLETADIKMPEDGHVYVFTNTHPTNGLHYLYHDQAAGKLLYAERGETAVNDLPDAAKFVCHAVGNDYYFANIETGNYLIWRGSNAGTNGNTSYLENHDATFCTFKMERCVTKGNDTNAATSNADFFGCVNFGARRTVTNNGVTSNGNVTCFLYDNEGSGADYFNQDMNWTPRYTTRYSTAFYVEEVTDYTANSATLRKANDREGFYSTLWLNYPVAIPEGVEAYTAAADGNNLRLTKVEGGALPRETGVVLYSETELSGVLFAPANQTIAGMEKGELTGSKDNVTATGSEYALSGAAGRALGFYLINPGVVIPAGRAYYQPATQTQAQGFALVMGADDVTGITAPATESGKPATIHDLQGRSVKNPGRGIYIVNGKKVILK